MFKEKFFFKKSIILCPGPPFILFYFTILTKEKAGIMYKSIVSIFAFNSRGLHGKIFKLRISGFPALATHATHKSAAFVV